MNQNVKMQLERIIRAIQSGSEMGGWEVRDAMLQICNETGGNGHVVSGVVNASLTLSTMRPANLAVLYVLALVAARGE